MARSTHQSGFFDLQVNGYAGVDFNSDGLTAEDIHKACDRLAADGVQGILATIITDTLAAMCGRLSRIAALRQGDELAGRIIAGVHIEGPFINPKDGFRGAHPADSARPADEEWMKRLLEAAGGLTRLVTLAPEQDLSLRVTRLLAKAGVTVSAGHSDASLDQFKGALDAGLTMYTHLGNGCPMLLARHDNIIQRVLSLAPRLWVSFIADGVHVPFPALGNYLNRVGMDRAIVVSDAIAPAGMGPGRYKLGRWDLVIGPDMVGRAPDGSHLIGSGITMKQSRANLISELGLSAVNADRLTRTNPRKAVGLG